MDFKRNRKVIKEALREGCRTMAELAHYLKESGKNPELTRQLKLA